MKHKCFTRRIQVLHLWNASHTYIRHKHPSLTDAQITSILTDAKNQVKYSDLPKPNENGIYSIDDTLAKLEELVLKYAEEYTK